MTCLLAFVAALTLTGTVPPLTVTSTDFPSGGRMPVSAAFGPCGGTNRSPDLTWKGAPAGTKSFVITTFDPDAHAGAGFWHWILYNIPPNVTSIAAGAGANALFGVAGINDHGTIGYGGTCPPVGDRSHHYRFTVSALDSTLKAPPAPMTPAALTAAMRGHVIAQGTYVGLYSR